jgi:hypothetical protein
MFNAVLKLKSYDKKSTNLPISINRATTFHLKSLNTKKSMSYADGSVFCQKQRIGGINRLLRSQPSSPYNWVSNGNLKVNQPEIRSHKKNQ